MILWLVVILFVSTLVLDQYTKWLVVSHMELSESIPIINNVFHLTYVRNSGAAWGILQNQTTFFIIVSSFAIIGLLLFFYYNRHENTRLVEVAISLILSGAIGNLIDRVKDRSVVDFFDARIFPIFNVADVAICVGVGLFLLDAFMEEKRMKDAELAAASLEEENIPPDDNISPQEEISPVDENHLVHPEG